MQITVLWFGYRYSLWNSDDRESINSVATNAALGRAYARSVPDLRRCRGYPASAVQLAFAGMGGQEVTVRRFGREVQHADENCHVIVRIVPRIIIGGSSASDGPSWWTTGLR